MFNDYSKTTSKNKYRSIYGEEVKILSPKQMLNTLTVALAQKESGNTSENLLNEIRIFMHSLYWEKEITKKAHNNIINSLKLWNKMNAIFTSSKNSKTSDRYRILVDHAYKINLKISDRYVALLNFSIYYTWTNIKRSY